MTISMITVFISLHNELLWLIKVETSMATNTGDTICNHDVLRAVYLLTHALCSQKFTFSISKKYLIMVKCILEDKFCLKYMTMLKESYDERWIHILVSTNQILTSKSKDTQKNVLYAKGTIKLNQIVSKTQEVAGTFTVWIAFNSD